ncbi:MAG TPA: hypothetical protein VMH40_13030 [Myxococcaceae bacterium]|nr:hypothetical protein [Myxococcaceae bacterium]
MARLVPILLVGALAACSSGSVPGTGTSGGPGGGSPSWNGVLPADRATVWNPGLNAVGGIPTRTTVYKTLTPSGGDDTQAIQDALDSCPENQVVKLAPGTFQITGDGLSITRSNVVLRGSGSSMPGGTLLTKPLNTGMPVIIIGLRWFELTPGVPLSQDAPKGSTSITLTSNPGYKVGELVYLNQLADDTRSDTVPPVRKVYWGTNALPGGPERGWFCEYNRPIGQALEIASIQGNTLTLTTPIHIDFETALSAHVVRITDQPGGDPIDAVRYSGIEDLAVENGDGGDGGGNIHLFATAYSWVRNVDSAHSIGHSCNLEGTFRSEVRDSYFHETLDPNPGGAGYGIGLTQYASDNLYENNVVWDFNKMTLGRASGGGNVFGYNYFTDGYGETYPDIVEIGAGPNHYAGAHMELFEGNEGFNFDSESYWGNAIYATSFRNHWTGLRRSAAPLDLLDAWNRRAVGVQVGGWWYSFLGDVLGFPGMPLLSGTDVDGNDFAQLRFIYQSDPNNLNDDSSVAMWQLGYDGTNWPDTADPLVLARTYRHGNFDYASGSVHWDPSNANRTLPASLYLAGKPAFFGSNRWPWVDSTAATDADRIGVLPAKVRFDATHASKYP